MKLPGSEMASYGIDQGGKAKNRVSMYREKCLVSDVCTTRDHRSVTARLKLGKDVCTVTLASVTIDCREGALCDHPKSDIPAGS
jgi:hypothetical protein